MTTNTTDFAQLVSGDDVTDLGRDVGRDFAAMSDLFVAEASARDAMDTVRKGGLLPNIAAGAYAKMSADHGVSVDPSLWLTCIAADEFPTPKGDAAALKLQRSLQDYDAAIQAVVMSQIKSGFIAGRDRSHPRTRPMLDDNGQAVLDANGKPQMIGGFSEVVIAWKALGQEKLTGEQWAEFKSANQVLKNMVSVVRKLVALAPVMAKIDERFGAADSLLQKKDHLIKLATSIRERITEAAKASRLYTVADAEAAIDVLTAVPAGSATPNRDKANRIAKALREQVDLLGEQMLKMRDLEGEDGASEADIALVGKIAKLLTANGFVSAKDRGDAEPFPWSAAIASASATPDKPAAPVNVPAAGGKVVKPTKPGKPSKAADAGQDDMLA